VRLAALQTQVDQGLAALDAVVDLGAAGLAKVLAFDGVITAPFTPAALAFGGDSLWLLDSQRGRVFRVVANGQSGAAEVYRVDANYGSVVAREPTALAWDAKGGRLLVLDNQRELFAVKPGEEPAPLTVRGIRDLKSAAAIASYDGNLYVLDPAGGEVWRYLPGGDGFDSERTNTLGGIDIGDARALTVDGEFYLLGAAGVRHFRQDRELPALLKGVDRALSSPAGLVVDSPRRLTYVADRGGRRVVVSDGEGNYLKQYRHPQFFDLRGIALSPDGNTVYALTGDGIYSFVPVP
jgi:DNA-binding beta-propeller fold protein YncE